MQSSKRLLKLQRDVLGSALTTDLGDSPNIDNVFNVIEKFLFGNSAFTLGHYYQQACFSS